MVLSILIIMLVIFMLAGMSHSTVHLFSGKRHAVDSFSSFAKGDTTLKDIKGKRLYYEDVPPKFKIVVHSPRTNSTFTTTKE